MTPLHVFSAIVAEMFHATSYLSKAWKGTKSEKQPASRGRPSVERNCPTRFQEESPSCLSKWRKAFRPREQRWLIRLCNNTKSVRPNCCDICRIYRFRRVERELSLDGVRHPTRAPTIAGPKPLICSAPGEAINPQRPIAPVSSFLLPRQRDE
jgi:hypothetical protein